MDEEVVRGTALSPEKAMRLAMHEAKKGFAFTSPNPQVGCVILDREGKFLASGYHEKFGEPHAEINALAKVSEADLKGAQVFVTLEPCAHEGKTPSCAKKLATLPLSRVIYGVEDPNPLTSGQGAKILQTNNIPTDLYRDFVNDKLESELEETCEAFLWNHRHKKIFVALKMAVSRDGRVGKKIGELSGSTAGERWVTGPDARMKGHYLRAEMDGILVGSGTLEHDNPRLDIRIPNLKKENRVVILDTEGQRMRDSRRVFAAHKHENIFWVVAKNASITETHGVQIVKVPRAEKGLDFEAMLAALYERGLCSVLVEGGAGVASEFLRKKLVNRLHLFQAPMVLGDRGVVWEHGFPVDSDGLRPKVSNARTLSVGPDSYLTGLLRNPHSGV